MLHCVTVAQSHMYWQPIYALCKCAVYAVPDTLNPKHTPSNPPPPPVCEFAVYTLCQFCCDTCVQAWGSL